MRYFSARGWNIAATMRNPNVETELATLPGVRLYALDVTKVPSIQTTLQNVLADFGTLDGIVNNAGYGTIGVFEKATEVQIREQFETNVFGVMNVIRAVLPLFRKQNRGLILNITSMGGLVTFPLYSVYHATKWALEGFSESLAFELRQFNIILKNIEPGAIKTDFYRRSRQVFSDDAIVGYEEYEQRVLANLQRSSERGADPEVVAKKIFQAAECSTARFRYPAGGNARLILALRKILPDAWFFKLVRNVVEKTRK